MSPPDLAADLRALTVRQPWASALVEGSKPVENRSWAPKGLREGRPLWVALHAATRDWPLSAVEQRELGQIWPGYWRAEGFPRGALIGLVRFDLVVGIEDRWDSCAWSSGPCCWLAGRALRLDTPIPCRGALGLWRVPAEHLPTLQALMGGGR